MVPASRASPGGARRWQTRAIPEPGSLKGEGHAVFVQDEAIFVGDAGKAARHRSPVGGRIHVAHAGSHKKFVAFGPVSDYGSQLFRTRDALDAPSFVPCLRETHHKFGRIAVVADRAPQHRARKVRDLLRACGGEAGLSGPPVGSPQLNAMEEVWRRGRLAIRDPEHRPGIVDMRAAAGGHFRRVRHRPGIFAYLGRAAVECCTVPGA